MATAITMTPIVSSQLDSIGHDAETGTLAVRFKPGKIAAAKGEPGALYHYANVDAATYDALAAADSIGSHFYREIKPKADQFPFTKINEAAATEGAAS